MPTGKIVLPELTGNLLTCKEFLERQDSAVDIAEAKKAYAEYRQQYELRFAEIFYTDHKGEAWFVEKYDPVVVQEAVPNRVISVQHRHNQFISEYQAKTYAGILLRDSSEIVPGAPLFAFDPNSLTLFLGLIPINIWRKEVMAAVHAAPGFLSLSFSEPIASQGYCRYAWAKFDTSEHCEESCRLLSNVQVTSEYAMTAMPSQKTMRKGVKTQPPQSLPGLVADWKQSAALISHVDAQYHISENPLLIPEERFQALDESGKELQMDLQLLYLRRVHGVCYFCADVCEDERELAAKCGLVHLRSKITGAQESRGTLSELKFGELLKKTTLPVYDPGKDEKLASLLDSLYSNLSTPEPNNKVRCSLCKKLFFDQNYLRKHIQSKHSDLRESILKTHNEKLMFERFLQECCKFVFTNITADNSRTPGKRLRDDPYEDLDDPKRRLSHSRRIVDYSDI